MKNITTIKNNPITRLLSVMLFDHISLNVTFPILTFVFFDTASTLFAPATSTATRSFWYGLCISLPNIGAMLTAPILSTLSDYYGRKSLLLIGAFGALIYGLSGALGILLGSIWLILLGRLIGSLCSRTNPIAQAVIGDISSSHNKINYMGYLQLIISIGAFIGPIIGGFFANRFWFNELNFSLPFYIAAVIAIGGALLTALYFQETISHEKFKSTQYRFRLNDFKNILMQKSVVKISLILMLSQLSWSTYYQFIPPLLKRHFAFSAPQVGLFVGLIALWLAVATAFGVRWLQKFYSAKQMIVAGCCSIFCGLLLTLFASALLPYRLSEIITWIAAAPVAMGDVIAYCAITALYSDAVDKTAQGKVMGVCFIIVSIVWSLTGLIGGIIGAIHATAPFIIAPLGVGILLLSLALKQSRFNLLANIAV